MLNKLTLIFCAYLPFQIAFNPAPKIDLASIRVFFVFIFIVWILSALKNKKIEIPNKIQTILVFSFLFLNLFSLLSSQNIDWSIRKLFFLFSFFPLYLVFSSSNPELSGKKIIRWIVTSAGAVSLVAIFQFLLQFIVGLDNAITIWKEVVVAFLGENFSREVFEYSSWLVNISGKTYFRGIAFFPDPHIFSFFLGMILPWSFALYFFPDKNNKKEDGMFLSIFFVILIADLLTFSRGGYVGLLAGIFSAYLLISKNRLKLSILTLIILTMLFLSPAGKRFASVFDLSEGSNKERIGIWKKSVEVIIENPEGVGLGNYPLEIKPTASYREPIYSHNLYLDIAAETGIANALFFILLIVSSLFSYYKKSMEAPFWKAGIASLIIFSAHSLFETPLFSVHVLPLFVILISLSAKNNE